MGKMKLTQSTGGNIVVTRSSPSRVSTSAPVCVPVYRRKVARRQSICRGTHHHHPHPRQNFRHIHSIRCIKSGLVEEKEIFDENHHHHYREGEQGGEAATGKLDRVLPLLSSSTHACTLKCDMAELDTEVHRTPAPALLWIVVSIIGSL